MLLAIDTSAGTSVAVVDRDAGVLSELTTADTMRHAEVIGGMIRDALAQASVPPARLSGVVAGMGPGPFTGLRVGIAAAKAFAIGAGKPLVPVVSHDAVALERYGAGHVGPLLIVTDARRRELYWSEYGGVDEHGIPLRTGGPGLSKPDDVPQVHGRGGRSARFDAATVPAGQLGLLAEWLYEHGRPFADDRPLYLRSPDVTPSAGPKRVTA
ncbi:tRNA (adenosine(37)-N6)-threonylcarbamoyltransferase complex dimerization subunit type 1 TsaB [Humibacter ginsenosidimutans]|uniref:tRNA (Adenosine(37)-N6)-threonylcarbamoyltransferase complex dimerization subunit type 1 TsaB n=1 Tax=Humibacter ginsenosidimutans TaxID=2599293 RepID=A0A5B8M426_9MICO|nr:tRNA (adenosine(37)-N6)-threonylcarbamoyltransferase complex dimerization subunit type 1 TsaB [Humibacter ginsenosidimutans]QDZ14931.1 tRNA (adenosine(37)-N6)-threonylcarbamoyltransferase complex dimerization subunit type 1 TsaB [Humibacter ginsenosidimutans]